MGPPGSGKTILANQICFSHVAAGGHGVYITLLAESHDRMFDHLSGLSFFDRRRIGHGLTFISAYQQLEKHGLGGLIGMLKLEILRRKPSFLVIDGLAVASEVAGSSVAAKKFVHELNVFTAATACTVFLMTSVDEGFNRAEHTMVDGIIGMRLVDLGMRTHREIEVRKLRGSFHLQGRHYLAIGGDGIAIYPRLEALLRAPSAEIQPGRPVSTGIAGLDRITSGGLPAGTVTVLLGAAGTGKTILGCQFLAAGIAKREPGLYYGLYETIPSLLGKARRLGLAFDAAKREGLLTLAWRPPTELSMDALAHELLGLVRAQGIKRLFLDGASGLFDGSVDGERLRPFLAALANELRALEVTTLMAEESRLFDPASTAPVCDLASVTENIVFLRSVELDSRLDRIISVVKLRDGECDRTIHRFAITNSGITLRQPIEGVEELLTGEGKRALDAPPRRRRSRR